MDFCKVLESWDWFAVKELRELFLKTIFEVMEPDFYWPNLVKVRLTKEFSKKIYKIINRYNELGQPRLGSEVFYFSKKHIKLYSFVDLWELKRKGLL